MPLRTQADTTFHRPGLAIHGSARHPVALHRAASFGKGQYDGLPFWALLSATTFCEVEFRTGFRQFVTLEASGLKKPEIEP